TALVIYELHLLYMIEDAERKNLISSEKPTSGNMGISMAFMAALKGYKISLTMSSYTSLERRVTMRIWEDTMGKVDIFVMGVGKGGTVSGIGRYLKSINPNVKVILMISPHAITGNGAGFKPDILDMDILEEVIEASLIHLFHTLSNVTSDDAVKMAMELALKEGLM
ncbi:hypothetical protein MKX03_013657, partial [Papaver bracteatum]